MKSDKGQSLVLLGIGMILIACVCVYIALSQPKISSGVLIENSTAASVSTAAEANTSATGVSVNSSSAVSSSSASATSAPASTTAAQLTQISYPLNLNTATAEELMSVDGIGEQRAASIISYREYLGGFTSVEQLKDISGFGDAIYEKVAPYFTV